MKEYDIFIPLYYNDGRPVEARKFQELQDRLISYFGACTFDPQPRKGIWRMGEVTYRDEIVIYSIVTAKGRSARRYLKQLKEELKKVFKQEEIFIVIRDVETL